ncbi:MAG: ABC transporter permease subunit, partial [Betaproteobacteria bacterium]|nr:ABC transporter permease subunit [Betaproteobacteria bacterium]
MTTQASKVSGSDWSTKLADRTALLMMLLGAWYAGTALWGDTVLPSPSASFTKLLAIMHSDDFAKHAWETLRAFLSALLISWFGGLLIGIALGAHRLTGEIWEPILVALYSIPKIALYPVVLLLFGLGISAKIAFGALHGIVPVILFSMNAVRHLPKIWLRAAQSMRLTPAQTARHIMVPACVPEIVSGFRIGFSLTLLGTLIGEMFASQRGIGHLLLKAMELNDLLS